MRRNFLLRWIIFVAVLILAPFIFEHLLFYSIEPLLQAGFFVILAVSLTLLVGLAGQISLGHAAFFGIGAYSTAIMALKFNFPPLLTIPLGTLAGAGAGFLIGYPVLKLRSYYLALATLGVGIATYEFFKAAVPLTGGEIGLYNLPNITVGSYELSSSISRYYTVWAFACLIVLFCDFISRSPFGQKLRALHSDEEAAESAGIDVFKAKLKVFVLSGTLASFAGTLFAHCSYGVIEPGQFSVTLSIKVITMVVLGGMYSVYGALLGAVIIALLPEMIGFIGKFARLELTQVTHIEDMLFGGILIAFIIFAPRGLLGARKGEEKNAPGTGGLLPFWRPTRSR